MKLVSLRSAAHAGDLGAVIGDVVVPVAPYAADLGVPELGDEAPRAGARSMMRSLLASDGALGRLTALEDDLAGAAAVDGVPLDAVRLAPPVPDPDKIICVGTNYRAHAEETGREKPTVPILFAKFRNTLIGAGEAIALPSVSDKIDYEGELAVVIGRTCKAVGPDEALDHVAGYTIFNDVSARDLQRQTSQWTAGKTLDTFGPCGPVLLTSDEVPDPQALQLETRLNGHTVQRATTGDMIFSVATLVAYVSSLMTLVPGDIIATGTPEGVGFTRTPPLYLADGDSVEIEIDAIGVLRNPVMKHG